ncbi:MAG: HD domain-containing phosphohydrolase [Candidatus Omnitrophota bacterium]|nr:HD domain-containing phosphohydrolase [Candidatus Omnitrophota bacterium]
MVEEIKNGNLYQKELFERLRKSVSLKKEEECIGCIIQPAAWWTIERPNPKLADLQKVVACSCPHYKSASRNNKGANCAKLILNVLHKAQGTKALTKFDCIHSLHGFIYPIMQGGKVYGYIGACYKKKDVSEQILDVFAAFTDTIVREAQKELELSRLYETIRPRAIALSTVHTVHRLISSTLELTELLPRIARLSLQIMRANRCSIKLVDSKRKILLPKATIDLRKKNVMLKKVKVGMHAPGKAFKYGRPIRGRDYIAVPLIDEDTIGVITVYDKIDRKPFTQFDQEIMSTMAEQAVIAIKNAQLYKEQERLTMGSIKSLAKVLDTRAPGTYVPRASFLKIALVMGQEMRLDTENMKSLEYAAILHDAGEIVVPYAVLTKPSKLTGKEYEIVKAHPMAGVELIKHMKALKSVMPIILHHHENYDGSGYPKGLKKEQIPIGARIMAVVSAFEAMITKRPYRTVRKISVAIEEIRKNSGTQFDPKIVHVFLTVMHRKDVQQALEKELYGHR